MNSQRVFCPNPACPATGRTGAGNINIHDRQKRRYRCTVCRKAFSERKGTAFYRLRKPPELVVTVLTLLAYGCPLVAIVQAFGLAEQTIQTWLARAGQHCEQVHAALVEQPRELGEVQCDEIRVKVRHQVVAWLALALQPATRLWLGGALSAHRDTALLTALIERVKRGALCRPLLFVTDGLATYVSVIKAVFRERVPRWEPGRPALTEWPNLLIAQVVKQYARHRVVGVARRLVQGTAQQIEAVRYKVARGGVLNTAFIERFNATLRAHIAPLVRRTRALAANLPTLQAALWLTGTVYNFCHEHKSLRLPGLIGGHRWLGRTPAMAAGLTDHCWTVRELLMYRPPAPKWGPPKQRGRPSQVVKELMARWAS